MTTPASVPAPGPPPIADYKEEKRRDELEEDTDVDARQGTSTFDGDAEKGGFDTDLEKGVQTQAASTRSDDQTLGGEAPAREDEDRDPNIVDWDGPDDPANPQNWKPRKKWILIAALSACTLITPLASSFFAPGVPKVMAAFHETSRTMASFVVSIYILGFAIGPLIIAPLSELYGRMPIYNVCNLLFIVFNITCAKASSFDMLIAMRFLAGCAGAAPLTIGGGTIADMFPREQRAGAMAIWSMGPLLGPVIGPVCGGFLVEDLDWRWVFWILAIFGGLFGAVLMLVGNETYHPTLLEKKAARLRKETGNPDLRSKLSLNIPPKELFIRSIVRPMKMLFFSPIVALMSLYVAINYGILYLFFTTFAFVFEGQYQFSSGAVGLSYIGTGVGMLVGMVALGTVSDRYIKKHQKKGNVKPEHRLPLALTLPGAIGLPVGVFVYAWTTEYKVHWIVPIIGTAFVGLGNLTGMMTVQTYLVDAFTIHAASVIAASTVLRSIFGAVLPLAGLSMYDAMGLGWGNSLLGFISLALIPVPVLFRYYGERIRTNPRFQVTF